MTPRIRLLAYFPFTLVFGLAISLLGAEALAKDIAGFSEQQICKAAISVVMGRDPKIMRIDKVSGGVTYLSYIRADDQTEWSFRCKIAHGRVIWASDTGRWRTHSEDSVIRFSIAGSTLFISERFSDGSSGGKRFRKKDLDD